MQNQLVIEPGVVPMFRDLESILYVCSHLTNVGHYPAAKLESERGVGGKDSQRHDVPCTATSQISRTGRKWKTGRKAKEKSPNPKHFFHKEKGPAVGRKWHFVSS